MILSQILTADQVPQGSYSATQQTLEHSQTDIVLSTANDTVTVPAADLIDGATGNPISGPLAITLSFPDYPRVITEGTVSNLALDFNLSASNTACAQRITDHGHRQPGAERDAGAGHEQADPRAQPAGQPQHREHRLCGPGLVVRGQGR